ncbi:hypothetical protein JTB14_002156 [Gonioctena quinquepunctata]|nr:hypothetical protein JTB14_002156 [Gonioctena quinquepunctata]
MPPCHSADGSWFQQTFVPTSSMYHYFGIPNMNNIGLGSNVRTFVVPNPRSLPYAGTQQNENLFLPYIQVSHSQGAHSYFGKNDLGSLHMSNPHGGTVPPVMENISVNNKLCSAEDLESYESPPTYNNEGSMHPPDFCNYIETFVDVYNLDINKFSLMVRQLFYNSA